MLNSGNKYSLAGIFGDIDSKMTVNKFYSIFLSKEAPSVGTETMTFPQLRTVHHIQYPQISVSVER